MFAEAVLEELVIEKLALIPDHAKLVVGPRGWKNIAEVPETLLVSYHSRDVLPAFFTQPMIEIFNKRWQTLDLISMMQELQRTVATDYGINLISVKDTLSTLPTFQKTGEEHSS